VTKLTVICEGWRPLRKNTLLGFASINIVELGLKVHDVALHQKNGRTWAQLPARPWIKDGQLVTDERGKVQYSPLFEFSHREVQDAFSRAVIAAIERVDPSALALEAAT
jgi:hypothetical protein